jgi:pilus assembly protein Flp/PilA
MPHLLPAFQGRVAAFLREEEGAQVVEYSLIVAVVSIAIVAALKGVVTDTSFTGFIGRIKTCLLGTSCV